MQQPTNELQPVGLGRLVRGRREQMGVSLRALARSAGISSSYLGAIELERNPATGRPPLPSLRVLVALAKALQLDLTALMSALGSGDIHSREQPDANHTLLYILQDRPVSVLEHVARLHPRSTEQWVYIPDPREAGEPDIPPVDEHIALRCSWPFGSDPYPDRVLTPSRLLETLERDLRGARDQITAELVGIAIADCSSVMRWVTNPEAEVAFESSWAEDVDSVFRRALARLPSANVCVYHHDDIEALGVEIDSLATATCLLRTHDTIAVLDRRGRLRTGTPAAAALLHEFKPPGITTASWRDLCTAAAIGITRARSASGTRQG